jgi:hypothetical protein
MDTRSEKDSLLKNTRRLDDEEEGDQQHNDDAFEWVSYFTNYQLLLKLQKIVCLEFRV